MAHTFLSRPLTSLVESAAPLIERSIEIISPRWAGERLLARSALTELARLGANPRGAWRQASIADTGSSESIRAARERITMMWEAREIIQNFGFVKSIAAKFAQYVVGQIVYQADTDDIGLNSIYEDYINDWFLTCDLTGRFDFRKLMEIAYLGHKIDGDSGIITSFMDDDLKLQVIQGDRIGNPFDYSYEDGYYSGVITDAYGRPTAYRVFKRNRNNVYLDPQDIPRDNFLHILNPLTADQYRGVTVMDTGIAPARNIFDILQNEVRAVKALSGQTALVSTKGNSAGAKWIKERQEIAARAQAEGRPAPMMPSQEIKPGTVNYIADGDNITAFTYNRPSPAFLGLTQAFCRDIAQAWNADYNFFYDGNGGGGAVTRLGTKQTQRTFQTDFRMMRLMAIEPLIDKKLTLGIARGDIPPHPNFKRKRILGPEQATCDAVRESSMDIDEMKAGIQSLSEIVGRDGKQLDHHLDTCGRDARKILDVAAKYQVPVNMIQQLTPNANDPSAQANTPTAPQGGSGGSPEGGAGPLRPPSTNPPAPPATGIAQQNASREKVTELSAAEARDAHGRWTTVGGVRVRRGKKGIISKLTNYVKKHPTTVLLAGAAVAGAAIGGRAALTDALHTETGRPVMPGEDLRGKRIYRRLTPDDGMDTFAKHYGVVTQGGKVLHRTPGSDKFRAVKMETFQKMGSGLTYVEEHPTDRSPKEVAAAAGRMAGKKAGKYKFFTENCEHGVNRVVEGRRVSRQVSDGLKATLRGTAEGAAIGAGVVSSIATAVRGAGRKKKK